MTAPGIPRRYDVDLIGRVRQWFPIDQHEKERNEIKHEIYRLCYQGSLHRAEPQFRNGRGQVLDVGCGTGLWATEMATVHPAVEVEAFDSVNMRPQNASNRYNFRIGDYLGDWNYSTAFTLVHIREMIFAVHRDHWQDIINKAYAILEPGGYLELASSTYDFQRHGDTFLHPTPHLDYFRQSLFEIADVIDRDLRIPHQWQVMLGNAGFEEIQFHSSILPLSRWRGKELRNHDIKKMGHGAAYDYLHTAGTLLQIAQDYLPEKPQRPWELAYFGALREMRTTKNSVEMIAVTGRRPVVASDWRFLAEPGGQQYN